MIDLLILIGLISLTFVSFALALLNRDLLVSVLWTGIGGVAAAACFFIMQAPDVAMSQAAVGGGLIPLIFVIAITKTERHEQ